MVIIDEISCIGDLYGYGLDWVVGGVSGLLGCIVVVENCIGVMGIFVKCYEY